MFFRLLFTTCKILFNTYTAFCFEGSSSRDFNNITIRKPDILSCGCMRIERSFEWIEMLKNLLKKIRSGLFYENNLWMYLYNRLELFFVIVERNIQWQRLIFKFDNKPKKTQWINLFEWNERYSSKKSISHNGNIYCIFL